MQTADGASPSPDEAFAGQTNVIPFPQRSPAPGSPSAGPTVIDVPGDPQLQLDQALLRLKHAIDEQRRAVEAWRHKLVALQRSVLSLSGNLQIVDDAVSAQQAKLERQDVGSPPHGTELSR